jgi:hypothetical protein
MFLNQIVKDMAGMPTVGRHTHTACQKDNSGLLCRNVNAASAPLIAGEVTLAIGAEAA